ncbi:MAG: transporter [Alphaproteobacteria bacterium]|nr:transporter [Deltaproteobacteria bacterium]MCB9690207.1 transporter [Alphaproteobacteria bacterium]
MTRIPSLLALSATLAFTASAEAQQPDPRDYEVAYFVPSNSIVANVYLRHASSQDGTAVQQEIAAFRATYILKWVNDWGDIAITPFDAIVPVVDATAHIPDPTGTLPLSYTARGSGVADILFLPTIGYGMTQDKATATHTWAALTTYFTIPVGAYDKTRLVNVGRNRLAINPLLVVGQRFMKIFTAELMGGLTWYGKNTEIDVPMLDEDAALSQKLSYSFMAHLGVDLHPTFFLGASYYLNANGDQTLELSKLNVPTPPADTVTPGTTSHALRLNMGFRLGRTTVLLAQYHDEIGGTEGAARSRFFGLRLSHVFALFTPETADPAKPAQGPKEVRE